MTISIEFVLFCNQVFMLVALFYLNQKVSALTTLMGSWIAPQGTINEIAPAPAR